MTSVHHCQGTMLTHHGGLHQSIPRLEHHPPAARPNCTPAQPPGIWFTHCGTHTTTIKASTKAHG